MPNAFTERISCKMPENILKKTAHGALKIRLAITAQDKSRSGFTLNMLM
jgi:hypothetical protein